MVDRDFCMGSFLMYRYVYDKCICFDDGISCSPVDISFPRIPVYNKDSLYTALKSIVEKSCMDGKAAWMEKLHLH